MTIEKKIEGSLIRLEKYIHSSKYRGYDPFDALNSPVLRFCSFNNMYIRVLFTQIMKRLPINLRPLLFTERGLNPKGLGLFLSGYVNLYFHYKDEQYLKKAEEIAGMLLEMRCPGYSGSCWGYNFDWQNTRFLFKKNTPTIVNTSFIATAFIELFQATSADEYLKVARSSCDFILNDINRTNGGDSFCFSYTPTDHSLVHNANMLGVRLLANTYTHTKEKNLLQEAEKSLAFTLRKQNPDGSWYYGEWDIQKTIDIYHTGFILESLFDYQQSTHDRRYTGQLQKGLNFFADNFFLPDGRPRYYHDRDYPSDIHAIQALVVLSRLNEIADHKELLSREINWFIDNMQDNAGYFYYRRGRFLVNRIPFIRW